MTEHIIKLPTMFARQNEIYKSRTRHNAVCCGRRFGKTKMMTTIASSFAAKGYPVAIIAPRTKQLSDPLSETRRILSPILKSANSNSGEFRTINDGRIDFWVSDDNELCCRGREYSLIMMDEAAFSKNGQMLDIWDKSVNPSRLTTKGTAWVFSTPNGIDQDNFFYRICNDKELGWKVHHAPTSSNPFVPADELEKERLRNDPLVFKQEYLAEFVDWSGIAFFASDKLLVDNQGVDLPYNNDYVFATIDSAMKDGTGNDGTAVIYWAVSKYFGHPLTVLDWDIVQINSDLLVNWLPGVFDNLEHLARLTKSRGGSAGAWIEDKGSGITLNQTCTRMGWAGRAIQGDITATGKDGRAISASGAVYRGEVKLSKQAYDKVIVYKGRSDNHLLTQVTSYHIGDKDAAKRADDLLDTFTYGVIIGLGGRDGF